MKTIQTSKLAQLEASGICDTILENLGSLFVMGTAFGYAGAIAYGLGC